MLELFGTGFFVVLLIIFVMVFLHFVPIGLWISAMAANVHVSIMTLVGMRMRRVPPGKIILPLIKANKAGLDVSVNQLEAHYLAGGNVDKVVDALIAVVSAVAKNGIELKIKARVTVRANIDRLVGGAGEPTIIARVGEGIVTTVGSSAMHTDVLANPDDISKTVLGKGLDAGTAFEILSIDIADVDVGRNIGAELQTDQAEADKRIAQAKAEERRAMARWRPRSWRRRQRFPMPWQRLSGKGGLASWTITTSTMCRQIRTCEMPSAMRAIPANCSRRPLR